ncbi:DNA methyltransferase [Rhodoblastus sphagnicola]|uniref:site-specific DNA-methyltransferase (adenine-specific) n=1 Tax=Rhodoblastus sphagnicola TaxID=333368 RepID=A0A2S6N2S7_9HYPH|nr:DNA adenine methylase [Rhodoblastus sphagnicola]MBB4199036.1 DNA adenine methylase [Rhodoblastus sphagnicola]PPQ28933.1 DNA methyltransferase [Rhodoblastus sphagnicola]
MEDHQEFRAAPRAKPAAGYIGGKRQLASRLAEKIAATPHEVYAEGFVGMGGVFFRRETAPRCEVINDMSRDVAIFFRVLQRHYQAFMDMLKWQLTSRAEFERLRAQTPDSLTDLERAARFLYLQKLSFGGKVAGRTFGVQMGGPARFDVIKLGVALEAIHARLAGVTIECLDWAAFLSRWDRPRTLFFLDPPYFGTEDYYGKDLFDPAQHEHMAEALSRIEGRFILTINDLPETRRVYRRFKVEAVSLTYSAPGSGRQQPAREIIVSN